MQQNVAEFYERWGSVQGKMQELMPNVMRGFGGMFQAIMKDGALSVREKELIALAVGVAVPCIHCINLHVRKCLEAGATPEQILEAAGVTVMMRGGPALTHIPEVITALEHCDDD
jgi:AhpD family alkylhydroperoxidase